MWETSIQRLTQASNRRPGLTPQRIEAACRGLREARPLDLMQQAVVSMRTLPLSWLVAFYERLLHLGIVFLVWWFLRDALASIGLPPTLVVSLAVIVVLYRATYDELTCLALHVLVPATGGRFAKWLCGVFLSSATAREMLLSRPAFERFIAGMAPAMPPEHLAGYDSRRREQNDREGGNAGVELNELS